MRTIFLGDAHLESPQDLNYQLLLRFLRELEGTTETLYIMGDLFDFWLGFPSNPFSQYTPLLEALASLKRSGCHLVYFEGNHDFHLGPVFHQRLGVDVHVEPKVLAIQGRRYFLCHGDQINRADFLYRFLRLLLHSRAAAEIVCHISPPKAQWLRRQLQKASRSSYEANSKRWNYREIIQTFAATVSEQGCAGLITGHFHLAFCEKKGIPAFTTLSLGDWIHQFTYGELEGGELFLKEYHAQETA